MNKHEFLYQLHQLLKPRGYLEIGVQHGTSLRLATCPAIGVEPHPVWYPVQGDNASIAVCTSDEFFAAADEPMECLDLVFIDGMHLIENVIRDFANVERWSHRNTVVVVDDVLPRNQVEGSRESNPGDWAGDVWKIRSILEKYRPDLTPRLVDTEPTGVMVVTGLDPTNDALTYSREVSEPLWARPLDVPESVLTRRSALPPQTVLDAVKASIR